MNRQGNPNMSAPFRLAFRFRALLPLLLLMLAAWPVVAAEQAQESQEQDTFDEEEVLAEAERFFGESTKGLAKVVEKIFKEQGRPNGTIAGEEISGAIGVGLRYGNGMLSMKSGVRRGVYWTGPSIGWDVGGNASKVFVLVYHLNNVNDLFQRYPGVDGSAYFVGGVGVNYQQSGDTILAPIRLGVGFRLGANVGYMHYTRKRSWNPF
jgi:hypothetical protein